MTSARPRSPGRPPATPSGGTDAAFATVVWASDGGACDRPASRYIHALCERFTSTLWIVHVAGGAAPGENVLGARLGAEQRIESLKFRSRALRRHGVAASLHVIRDVAGPAAPAIVGFTELVGADLLVLTARRHSRPSDAMPTATAAHLVADAPCPVLVLTRGPGTRRSSVPPAGGPMAG